MSNRICYMNDAFLPEEQAQISVYDLSVAQGAAAFTMTRSFNKQHWKLPQHIARLRQSCDLLSIPLPKEFAQLPQIIAQLTEMNADAFAADDEYRMMWVVSPGTSKMYAKIPGTIPHSWLYGTMFPLKYTVAGFSKYFTEGVHCVTSKVQQVPDACIPSSAKHRSRLHFHLAQQQAPNGTWPLLLDHRGFVTEAPGANLVAVKQGRVITLEINCLPGISLQTVVQLTGSETVGILTIDQLLDGLDELWLTGTPFAMVPVVSLDGKPIGAGTPGLVFKQTLQKWNELVGLDIAAQIQEWDAVRA